MSASTRSRPDVGPQIPTAPGAPERRDRALWITAGLLVATTVSWRRGVYYSGGVDPVVAAKGLMSVIALGLAFRSCAGAARWLPLSTRSLWFLGLFLITSMFGALSTGTSVSASAVDAVRMMLIAATVFLLLRARPLMAVLTALIGWMAVIALVGTVTGIGTLASGRLEGGIPPLSPNDLTELCGIVVIALIWRTLTRSGSRADLGWVILFGAIILATGSRTGLIALVIALVVVMVQSRRMPVSVVVVALGGLGGAATVVLGTNFVSHYLDRGGSANVSTLSSRTVAWSAALHLHHGFWAVWFGNGLSRVQIPVIAQYRTEQILDSSWISALVQTGCIGLGLFALWAAYAIVVSFRAHRTFRMLSTGLMTFVLLRSFLESGLAGASPVFLIFFVLSANGAIGPIGAAQRPGGHRWPGTSYISDDQPGRATRDVTFHGR